MKRFFTHGKPGPLTGGQLYLSGMVAGVANSVVASPVEHVRIRLQAQAALKKHYNGPLDALRQIWAAGGLRGVYHGLWPTILREGHGMGIYFWTYEEIVQHILDGKPRSELPATSAMLAGGSAGVALWAGVYPIECVVPSSFPSPFLLLPNPPPRVYLLEHSTHSHVPAVSSSHGCRPTLSPRASASTTG